MKHKKRGLALLLMLTLALLCGCEGTVSERPMEDISALTIEPGADAPTADTFADQTQTVTLYLLSPNGERLVPVSTEVTMRAGESLAQAALTALLAGAKLERTDASWPMSGEGRAPTLSVSAGIATVNLPAKYRALEPQTLFAVRQAVADTLGSLSGVTSVNVLVGGREEGLDLGATLGHAKDYIAVAGRAAPFRRGLYAADDAVFPVGRRHAAAARGANAFL